MLACDTFGFVSLTTDDRIIRLLNLVHNFFNENQHKMFLNAHKTNALIFKTMYTISLLHIVLVMRLIECVNFNLFHPYPCLSYRKFIIRTTLFVLTLDNEFCVP